MTEPISIERPKCSGLDCDGFAILNGMCTEHYWQANAEAQVRYQRKHAEAMKRAKERDARAPDKMEPGN